MPTPQAADLGPHDLLVKVAVASLCHTDFMMQEGWLKTKLPCTGSHEGAGTVVAKGPNVEKFHTGDRVMCGLQFRPCGKCVECTGPENCRQYCTTRGGALGLTMDGAFAEYLVCDARSSTKVPDSVSFETAAPLACAGVTVWRAVALARLQRGQWLAIVGSGGGLGHLGILFAKALGLKVVGIDARNEGLALSKQSGADLVVDVRQGDQEVVKQVHAFTDGVGVDAAVNVSDATTAAATACAVTKKHGVMVQVAQPQPSVNIPFEELIFRDIRVSGSLHGSASDAANMMAMVAEHGIRVKTNAYRGLDNIPKLWDFAHGGKMQGKGIVIVDAGQVP